MGWGVGGGGGGGGGGVHAGFISRSKPSQSQSCIRARRPITTEADAVESVMLCLVHRYSILAPNAIPQGFVDGKQVTDKILSALQLDPAEYRLGTTKVFFKAGVLGMLEDMRDERLSKIIAMFQAYIRGYLMRKAYKKLQDQR